MKSTNSEPSTTLKAARKLLNKSQQDIALFVGVKQQAVSLWESGKKYPTLDNAVKLAVALDMSLKSLAESMGIDVTALPDDFPLNKRN